MARRLHCAHRALSRHVILWVLAAVGCLIGIEVLNNAWMTGRAWSGLFALGTALLFGLGIAVVAIAFLLVRSVVDATSLVWPGDDPLPLQSDARLLDLWPSLAVCGIAYVSTAGAVALPVIVWLFHRVLQDAATQQGDAAGAVSTLMPQRPLNTVLAVAAVAGIAITAPALLVPGPDAADAAWILPLAALLAGAVLFAAAIYAGAHLVLDGIAVHAGNRASTLHIPRDPRRALRFLVPWTLVLVVTLFLATPLYLAETMKHLLNRAEGSET